MTEPIRCPSCNSPDTIAYPFGDDAVSYVYKAHYPHARKCVDCEHVWWPQAGRVVFSSLNKSRHEA